MQLVMVEYMLASSGSDSNALRLIKTVFRSPIPPRLQK